MDAKGHRVQLLAGIVAIVALLAGCATSPQDLGEVQTEMQKVRNLAEEAHNSAHRAEDQAKNAVEKAEQANRQSSKALQQAQQAQACCERNSEKIDRMFKKSMQK